MKPDLVALIAQFGVADPLSGTYFHRHPRDTRRITQLPYEELRWNEALAAWYWTRHVPFVAGLVLICPFFQSEVGRLEGSRVVSVHN